jgi:hypothetical protein
MAGTKHVLAIRTGLSISNSFEAMVILDAVSLVRKVSVIFRAGEDIGVDSGHGRGFVAVLKQGRDSSCY